MSRVWPGYEIPFGVVRGIQPASMGVFMNWFEENLSVLRDRFPKLAERALQPGLSEQVCVQSAQDGMPAYGIRQSGQLQPLTNPVNPMEKINQELGKWHEKTHDFSRPILVVGLNPGAEVLHLFEQREKATGSECAQPLWICVDSALTLCGFLQAYDARALLASERVWLFWHEEVSAQVQWLEEHPEFPYIFSMISLASQETQLKVFSSFLQLAKKRDQQMADYQKVNNAYYDAIDDVELARTLSGQAGRRPRLLVPSCPWSTVIQYSIRDTCRAFEKAGWETEILDSPAVIPSHYVMESINRFKPDVFLYVSHLRTEAPGVIPDNLMMVSWVQDPVPTINSSEAARQWNEHATLRKRDLLTGYVDQLRPFGYFEERMVPLNMIVDTDRFRPRELSAEQNEKYACDICFASNAGLPTDRVVREKLVSLLKPYGCTEPLLMKIHDRLWTHYRAGNTITHYDQLKAFVFRIPECELVLNGLDHVQQDALVELLFWRLNDLIYRHTVLEWLDEYATENPGFRLNLYGNDWDQHPRFSNYARGAIVHGEELSAAFQSARFCLHLNGAEGPHQRLYEILASGGVPLLRHSDDASILSPELAAAFRMLFAGEQTGGNMKLPEKEQRAWNTFLFNVADRELYAHPDWTHTDLCQRVQREISQRLRIYPDWMLSDWRTQTFSESTGLHAVLKRRGHPMDKEAWSIFPRLERASHAEYLCAEMLKMLGADCDFPDDCQLPNFTPILQHVVGLQKTAKEADWPVSVERVYEDCPSLTHVYAKTAWKYFVEADLAYDKALPFFERDMEMGRLDGEWLLHYAHTLAACGKASDAVVESAYLSDPNLANGYARCSWMAFFTLDYQPEKALRGFEKDLRLGRLSGQYQLYYAMLLASVGKMSAAEQRVEETYRSGRSGDGGYALLAWHACVIRGGQTDAVLECFARDQQLGRTATWALITEAGVRLRLGQRNEAEACVYRAYGDSAPSFGGYTTLAAIDFLINNDLGYALKMLEQDAQLERQLPFHKLIHAAFLYQAGDFEEASRLCRTASEGSVLAWRIAASWLQRSGYDAVLVSELLTSELHSNFDSAAGELLSR